METINGYIQLPYGYAENENDEKINLNLPKNFKKELLFDELPFVAQLNNPAIENVIKGKENDDISIQKFLLATGLLEDTIQNNLDMIVTDSDFNNAGIRRVLDQKYPTIMGKLTSTNFMFKDKAKFDIQNPVIGTIYNEILTDKQKEKKQIDQISNAPDIRDLDIRRRLDNLGKFKSGIDDDDDNNNNNNNSGRIPPPILPTLRKPDFPLSSGPLTPPPSPSSSSSIQKFLLGENSGKTAILDSSTPINEPKTVTFSETLTKVFPKIKRELIPLNFIPETDETEDFDITESSIVSNGNERIDLEFFSGGENHQKLFENATKNVGILSESNEQFLNYLSSNFGRFVLNKNKMKIHLESGKIFFDDKSKSESLYDFLKVQQDIKKKELKIDIPIQNDFSTYVREILSQIVDDDYDLQTNSTSKFLFYNFNNIRVNIERRPPIKVRHSEILENEEALKVIQNHNWQYFIETLLDISNNERLVDRDEFKDDEAFEDYLIIEKPQEKPKYCKRFYEEVFDDISFFLHNKIKETPDEFVEKMEEDLSNHRIFFEKLKEIESSVEFMKVLSNFYFKTGRFPGYVEYINVPPGVNPHFIEKHDQISPTEINEKFKNSSCYGLVSVQFIAALHVFFGGDKELSRNAMSEFLHNLSLQALTIDDDKFEIQFHEIVELNRNLKGLMRDDERNEIKIHENHFEKEMLEAERDRTEILEDEVVSNIMNKTKIEHPKENFASFPSTSKEITDETNQNETIKRKVEKALNQRDEEISSEIVSESRKDLIKSMTDNANVLSQDVLNNVSLTAIPKVIQKESVEEHIEKTIKKNNQDFIKRKKSSVKLKLSPIKSPRTRLTNLLTKEEKKPYEKK